jgi:predicted ATPase
VLVQETACSTLLRGPRQELLLRIARALEERFTTVADTQPEILAHHLMDDKKAFNPAPAARR